MAARLQKDGMPISRVVRDAIRAAYERHAAARASRRRASEIMAAIYRDHPDPPDVPRGKRGRRGAVAAAVARRGRSEATSPASARCSIGRSSATRSGERAVVRALAPTLVTRGFGSLLVGERQR